MPRLRSAGTRTPLGAILSLSCHRSLTRQLALPPFPLIPLPPTLFYQESRHLSLVRQQRASRLAAALPSPLPSPHPLLPLPFSPPLPPQESHQLSLLRQQRASRLAATLAAQRSAEASHALDASLPPPVEPSHLLIDRIRVLMAGTHITAAEAAQRMRVDEASFWRYVRCTAHTDGDPIPRLTTYNQADATNPSTFA